MHALRIANCEGPDPAVLREIETLKLGRRKHWHDQKRASQLKARVARRHAFEAREVGKTGGLALEDLDKGNRNGRPEVALLGHSNCGESALPTQPCPRLIHDDVSRTCGPVGKSALLNALIGAKARRGPAEVDSRAGWTMRLHFYWARASRASRRRHALSLSLLGALVSGAASRASRRGARRFAAGVGAGRHARVRARGRRREGAPPLARPHRGLRE